MQHITDISRYQMRFLVWKTRENQARNYSKKKEDNKSSYYSL
jgi:hypothetical protein